MKQSALAIAATLIIFALLICPTARAGQGAISLANVQCQLGGDTLQSGANIRFLLKYTNNTGERVNVSNGFVIQSPDGAMFDSVRIDSTFEDATCRSVFTKYFNLAFECRNPFGRPGGPDTVGLLAAGLSDYPSMMLPDGFDDTVLIITVFAGPSTLVSNSWKHICIDTGFFNPGGTWVWMDPSLNTYYPEFVGLPGQTHDSALGYCHMLYLGCGPNPVAAEGDQPTLRSGCVNCDRCCFGKRGNVNRTGAVDLADLAALVSYLTGGGWTPRCPDQANVNGTGTIDLGDLSALVSYLAGGGFVLPNCPM